MGTSPRKAVRELILTVMLFSVPGLSACSETGGLHSSLLNSLGSRGSVLSRGAHGLVLALAILGEGAPAWQAGCRDLCLTTATASGATEALLPRAQDGTFMAGTGCRESQNCGTTGLMLRDQERASSHCPGATLWFDTGTLKGR